MTLYMSSYSGYQCRAKDVSSIFCCEIEGSHPRKEPGRTHTHITATNMNFQFKMKNYKLDQPQGIW